MIATKTKKRKISDYIGAPENPFIENLVIEYTTRKKHLRGGKTRDGYDQITIDYMVDTEKYSKAFKVNAKRLIGLSQTQHVVWWFIISHLDMDSHVLAFTLKDVSEWSGIHVNNLEDAISELIERNIIWPKEDWPDTYFIDPKMAYNGDRIDLISEWRLAHGFDSIGKQRTKVKHVLTARPERKEV